MCGRISMAALFVFLVANLLQLQHTYGKTFTVGDSKGWQMPKGNQHFYGDWADHRIFNVGDVLVFNFTTGEQTVAEVSEGDFESCSAANPISNTSTGPAKITLTKAGVHLFICGIPEHCSKGQKMKVEVRGGSGSDIAPAPAASSSDIAPASTATPSDGTPASTATPSNGTTVGTGTGTGKSYTVGDSTGWVNNPIKHEFYDDWAEDKHFAVGDSLVFKFTTGQHNVMEVSQSDYEACTTTNPISTLNDGPAKVTFDRIGEYYFICGISGHCVAGQKMKLEVEDQSQHHGGTAPTAPVVATTVSLVFFVSSGLALLW